MEQQPKRTQAERVIKKFGNARALARLIGYDPSGVYKWTYPPEKGGTGGHVPTRAWPKIKAAARQEGIFLTGDDFSPMEM